MGLEWVVFYYRLCRLDRIVSAGLDWIVSYRILLYESGHISFYALAGYCLDGMDGVLVGRGLDIQMLAPAGTGTPPWAPEQERHH